MTDNPERLDLRSHDIAGDKREELLRLFPEARTEDGKIAFVPIMLAQGDECHVVNTASGAGLHTRPWLAMYCASKHAVVALSESLYHELTLTGSRVKVSVLCPAVVNTRIGESGRNRPAVLRNEAESGNPAQMQAMEQAFRALLATGLPAEEVAQHVVGAIREERFYIITHEETKGRVRARMQGILEGRNPALPRMA